MMKTKETFPVLDIDHLNDYPNLNFSLMRHEYKGKPSISIPHKHNFYHVLIIEKGSGSHTIDFITYAVSDYMIFFLAPDQVHQWELSPNTIGYQLMFTQPFLNKLNISYDRPFFLHIEKPYFKLNKERFNALKQELSLIELEMNEKDKLSEFILLNRLWIVLSFLERWYRTQHLLQPPQEQNHFINQLTTLVENHFMQQSSVQFYANKLHISTNYLNKLCKRYLNQSATTFIHHRILLEAKRLLATTALSVKEIAYTLGYRDPAYFTRIFGKYVGVSPTELRDQSRKVQD